MSLTEDLEVLSQQENLLMFSAFDADTAWRIGCSLRGALLARSAGGSVEIELGGQLLFACATLGAKPSQADWIRRKRNTVHRFCRSSYAVGRMLERDAETLASAHKLSETDFAAHGGGFPIVVPGSGCVGSVVLSGLPQRDDHNLVAAAIAQVLSIDIPKLSIPEPKPIV
jgi:uncharacterized protein (UPF0303 family)